MPRRMDQHLEHGRDRGLVDEPECFARQDHGQILPKDPHRGLQVGAVTCEVDEQQIRPKASPGEQVVGEDIPEEEGLIDCDEWLNVMNKNMVDIGYREISDGTPARQVEDPEQFVVARYAIE